MTRTSPEPDPGPMPVFRIPTMAGAHRPLMIAHRCGAGLGPENTRAAAVQSSFFRPDFYEIDLRHTSDGIAVCMHDDTLNRTTGLTGNLQGIAWVELQHADAGGWQSGIYAGEQVPALDMILDCVNPSPLIIELKEPEITPAQCNEIARLLNERDDISSVVASFHPSALETWREADEIRRTVYLTLEVNEYSLTGPHDVVGLADVFCTSETVGQIHDAGKAVWVWTVNEGFEIFMEMGVDGIITDRPDLLRDVLPPS